MKKLFIVNVLSLWMSFAMLFLSATEVFGDDAKRALIAGHKQMYEFLTQQLIDCNVKVDPANDYVKDQGFRLPVYEKLKEYDVLIASSGIIKECKEDVTRYVKGGGILVWLYDSALRTKQNGADFGFGTLGFDGYMTSHHEPYDTKTTKAHNLKYVSDKWGKTDLCKWSAVYCLLATDLFDAKAVVVNADHPERALATISELGEGKVLFLGTTATDALTLSYLKRMLEYAMRENEESSAWPVYKGRLVAENDYTIPSEFQPREILGRDFWNFFGQDYKKHTKGMSRITEEPMIKEAGNVYYVGTSLMEQERPVFNRLLLREVEIYGLDKNKNLAVSATVSAEAKDAQMNYLERIKDTDISPQGACYSSPPKSGIDQEGFFSFEFNQDETIERIVIHGGRARKENSADYVHLPSRFKIKYKYNDEWKDIPGTDIKNNSLPVKELCFEPVKTRAIRICIDSQSTPLRVSAVKLRELTIEPEKPFMISDGASRPPFHCLEDSIVNKEDYGSWKSNHPNFIGFMCGTEWDNEYTHYLCYPESLKSLRKLGASENVLKLIKDEFASPKDKRQALNGLEKYHTAIKKHHFGDTDKMTFMNCARTLDHYALEFGAGSAWIETTCAGYQRHQPQMFFIRGAIHQYDKPLGWYLALGMNYTKDGGGVVYTDPGYLGLRGHTANGGISASLNKRDRYLAYFSGASFFMQECFPDAYCQDKDNDGVWELSPHGEAMREWYDFTRKHQRGASYAPIALCMSFDHGQSAISGGPLWGSLKQERPDHMIEAFMREIVPWTGNKEQEGALSNSPYGDIFDVILPNTPKEPIAVEVLGRYKAAILLGGFTIDKALADRLMEYVKKGGTLFLNIKQLNAFFPDSFSGIHRSDSFSQVCFPVKSLMDDQTFSCPDKYMFEKVEMMGASPILVDRNGNVLACVKNSGRGNVVLTTVDYMLPENLGNMSIPSYFKWNGNEKFPFIAFLLERLSKEVLPMEVKGDIEYGLNKLKDGWLIYLINNKGIYKNLNSERFDPEQTVTVEINLKKIKSEMITELRKNEKISLNKETNSFSLNVGPGDVGVVKILTR